MLSELFARGRWPHYAEDEIAAATAVLRSGKVNYWTGEICREFERDYAQAAQRRHAIALANGTLALELALMAFGVGEGDEVITASRTYVASASCAVMRRAVPVIADVDVDSQCVTAETIRAALTPRTKAIVAVHLAGWPCPMDEIMALAAKHNLVVVEDCAQAHGATYRGKPVGSFGHAAAFSFCQDKIISTGGEGGMLVIDDEEAWRQAWAYKDIGRSYEAVHHREHGVGFRWLTESFGTNWRMTEMQAAIGLLQLAKLPRWIERRRTNAGILTDGFSNMQALRIPVVPEHVGHAWYRFYAFVRSNELSAGWDRNRIMKELNLLGVPCTVGSCSEIYLEKDFTDRGWGPSGRLPVARELGETSLAFLIHPTLSQEALEITVNTMREVMTVASR
jgi:dTDP-4-amino-4,6-dideoxygalactose transaminase